MNYHLMIDDKFIDGFIEMAEQVSPNKNIYLFTFNPPSTYVKSNKGIYALYESEKFKNIIKSITINDRLYVHWFHETVFQVIDQISSTIPIYLFFWGGDFIEQSKDFNDFNWDAHTRRYIIKREKAKLFYWTKNPINYLRMLRNYILLNNRISERYSIAFAIRKRFLERVDYFCHWNKLDLEIVSQTYGCAPKFMNFFYGLDLEKIEIYEKRINNYSTIWLGNSDTETNNHLDAIFTLSRYKNNDMRIICPLSYGNKKYGNFVSSKGQFVFADKWESVRNFMPFEAYLELLKNVDIVVMYHNRTQAAGNIFAFIKMGKKVYLKKQSTIFQLMINSGIVVFDANTIKNLSFEEFSKPLIDEQIQSNIEKISNLFSEKKRLEYLSKILN